MIVFALHTNWYVKGIQMQLSTKYKDKLPKVKEPLGSYERFSYANGIGKISGQFPVDKYSNLVCGSINVNEIEKAKEASLLVALNIVAQIENIKKVLEVDALLHIDCYVQSNMNDESLVKVVDEISLTLQDAFGRSSKHSRSLVIVSDLPLNAMMEVVTTFSYKI